jgi:hypothetical protein
MRIIFLDIDGVLNCELFYKNWPTGTYIESQICKERISWLNDLCKDVGAKVVISSTWRMGRTVEELKEVFVGVGATFEIIDKTPVFKDGGHCRGNEIYEWIKRNQQFTELPHYDYKDYVIIDDDSDMLLGQREHFFQVDNYSGLTPTTCYKIARFFGQPTFSKPTP